jgi:hypothetical protein
LRKKRTFVKRDPQEAERLAAEEQAQREAEEQARREAEEAAKLTVNDVADGTTLETLKDAITLAEAVENAPTCPANGNASDFTKATDDIRTYADNLRNITNELDAAAKSVIASQELKLESAK